MSLGPSDEPAEKWFSGVRIATWLFEQVARERCYFLALRQINDELVYLCNWLKQRGDLETASRLAPIVDSLTRVLIQIAEKKLQP
jgi:hypothetical protein